MRRIDETVTAKHKVIYRHAFGAPSPPGGAFQMSVRSVDDPVLAALGGLVAQPEPVTDDEIDEEALMTEVERSFAGTRPLSEIIIEERRGQM
jgi:hypothetical protein